MIICSVRSKPHYECEFEIRKLGNGFDALNLYERTSNRNGEEILKLNKQYLLSDTREILWDNNPEFKEGLVYCGVSVLLFKNSLLTKKEGDEIARTHSGRLPEIKTMGYTAIELGTRKKFNGMATNHFYSPGYIPHRFTQAENRKD